MEQHAVVVVVESLVKDHVNPRAVLVRLIHLGVTVLLNGSRSNQQILVEGAELRFDMKNRQKDSAGQL